tara:strand:+ start:804 stop:1751 length:948 start_codon:yes stop_codon:yes gene_type:complete
MKHGSLFSGIGGFDLASEWMGWENVFHCEWEEFPRKILNYHFPKSISYGDIKKTDFTIHRGQIDILTGGFPCQPYSAAGKRLGKQDERHLFPEMLRAIREIQPRWVVGENVRGIVSWNGGLVFDEVHTDLENEGYEVQSFILPAASVNAPHKRDRVWFVAYANDKGGSGKLGDISKANGEVPQRNEDAESSNAGQSVTTNTHSRGLEGSKEKGWDSINVKREGSLGDATNTTDDGRGRGQEQSWGGHGGDWIPTHWDYFPTQPPVCGGDDGIPRELDGITFPKWRKESIKGYGNAIVPQVVYPIFKAIKSYEELK